MSNTKPTKCPEEVWNGFHSHTCGRRITPKDPDGKMCGLHYAAKIRREQKRRDYDAATERQKTLWAEVQRIEQGFREHGIKARVELAGSYPNTQMSGNVTISLEDLRTLIVGQGFDS